MASIAVAVTTHNRPGVFAKSIVQWRRLLPDDADLFVVDDGSTTPVPDIDGVTVIRNSRPLGIAGAKNVCLRATEGYDHVFLVDDDVWPVDPRWWLPYVNSKHQHLATCFETRLDGSIFSHDVRIIEKRPDVWVYECGNGCIMYMTREAIDTVGGYDEKYGRWGYEHRDYTMRIHLAGITEHPFMDVPDGAGHFRILDREGVPSSVPPSVRPRNNHLRYQTVADRPTYIPLA